MGRIIVINEYKWCMVDLVSTLTTWALVIAYVWSLSRNGTGAIAIEPPPDDRDQHLREPEAGHRPVGSPAQLLE